MACSKPEPCVLFYVTGFGCFNGVARNPTEKLVTWIGRGMAAQAVPPPPHAAAHAHAKVLGCTVLTVSAGDVQEWISQMLGEGALEHRMSEEAPGCPLVLLHFGVGRCDHPVGFTCPY